VVRHFQAHGLRFPTRLWGKRQGHEVRWGPLTHSRVLAVLHNPAYAGTYVYGRPHTRPQVLPGEAPRVKGRPRTVAPADWPVVHREAPPGYCPWEQWRQHQHQLDDNRTFRPEDRRGAVREGAALLPGLVLCGQCGRRMRVRSLADGTRPCYDCVTLHVRQASPTCQSIRGDGVDAAGTQLFLQALTPAQLAVSLATLEQVEAQARQIARQWQLRLERAQYEADLARRRFVAVEPEPRLGARTLERDWNDKLAALATLERERAATPPLSAQLVSPAERQRILALAPDVPAVWQAGTTTPAERKQLLRCRIKDVTLLKQAQTIAIAVRWPTAACPRVAVPRPARAAEVRRTAPAVIERIRTLASYSTDSAIAPRLNQDGASPGLGGTFSAAKVAWVRYAYGIAPGCPEAPGRGPTGQPGDGRYSARAAAELLNVDVGTIADWCQAGQLDSLRKTPRSPRWIFLTPALIAALRKPVRQRKPRCRSHE